LKTMCIAEAASQIAERELCVVKSPLSPFLEGGEEA